MITERYKFSKDINPQFFNTLKVRVNAYFDSRNISKQGNSSIMVKAVVMMLIYFVPFVALLSGWIAHPALSLLMWVIMGVGMAGIGLSVMHDGNHGAFSKNKFINKITGLTANFIGGNAKLWKIQHNVLHHTFTNVYNADEDIDGPGILRFSPNHERKKIHRYQHIYAVFLYGLMTLGWAGWADHIQANSFKKKGLIKENKFAKEMFILTIWKLFYFLYVLVIPIVFFDLPLGWTLLGFLMMHITCGVFLSLVFQSAHVVPTSEFPLPNDTGVIENNWAIHQLLTTANFAPNSRIFSWFIGGLNYQIEHHLFSNISHVHYRKLSKIVKETAAEYNLPYHSQGNFLRAVSSHLQMLKQLGRA
jgi:linoleoyl-CoA desaturase